MTTPNRILISHSTHLHYLRRALSLAALSPPKPTNYCVGAVLVLFSSLSTTETQDDDTRDEIQETILSTGYTLELEGNTHAEQCCLSKLATAYGVAEVDIPKLLSSLAQSLPPSTSTPASTQKNGSIVLYTTMEPCIERLSNNLPCVDRIIAAKHIDLVVCGVSEPDTFVQRNEGRARLEEAGVRVLKVEEDGGALEREILRVARAGHGAG